MSGYTNCSCRDCFEIAIGDGYSLCLDCETCGCIPWCPDLQPSWVYECEAWSYGSDD